MTLVCFDVFLTCSPQTQQFIIFKKRFTNIKCHFEIWLCGCGVWFCFINSGWGLYGCLCVCDEESHPAQQCTSLMCFWATIELHSLHQALVIQNNRYWMIDCRSVFDNNRNYRISAYIFDQRGKKKAGSLSLPEVAEHIVTWSYLFQ